MTDFWDYDRPNYRRTHKLYVTRNDADAFGSALRDAFPNIRFVSREYWKPFVDWAHYERNNDEWRRRNMNGLPQDDTLYRMRHPRGESLSYWDSPGTEKDHTFLVWLEPKTWRPAWSDPNDVGIRKLSNIPIHSFVFERGGFKCADRPGDWLMDPPSARDDDEVLLLDGFRLQIRWNNGDHLGEQLAKSAFRMLRKMTVERFHDVDSMSHRAFFSEAIRRPAFSLAGKDAAAWTNSRRHNYLNDDSGYMKAAPYNFLPEEIFTEGEIAARNAMFEAELAARLAARGLKPLKPRKRK